MRTDLNALEIMSVGMLGVEFNEDGGRGHISSQEICPFLFCFLLLFSQVIFFLRLTALNARCFECAPETMLDDM